MKKKGSALLVVVIVMGVVFLMATMMIDSTLKSNKDVSKDLNDLQAYYLADSGVNYGISYLCALYDSSGSLNTTFNNSKTNLFGDADAAYNITITKVNSNNFNIVSIGTYKNFTKKIYEQIQIIQNTSNGNSTFYYTALGISKKVY